MNILGFDIGSNSVGSAWIEGQSGRIVTGVSIFPAGVDESDDKRGDPKNAKRRMTRRTRITLARRAQRKRAMRRRLIEAGLLPPDEAGFKALLEQTDPWELRRRALDEAFAPFEFGRVLLHLAQRRGALGLKVAESAEDESDTAANEDGKVKAAIGDVKAKMAARDARTFGEFIAMIRAERVTPLTSEDRRPIDARRGPREYRDAIRNKAGNYEHCADRGMIRSEFAELWNRQRELGGGTARLLTDELRSSLDDESGDSTWRHRGLLFGQRRQSWDLGTLGRCVLEPSERCAPHADMYASRFLVVETVNNLKVLERGQGGRPLSPNERQRILDFLSGPLGTIETGKYKGQPKRTVSVTDLRNLMGTAKEGWGRASKTSHYRFNIENDEDRTINTDWFSREIIHGAVTPERWVAMRERVRDGLNRAILKFDPDQDGDADRLRQGVLDWAGLSAAQADALVEAWRRRPKLDAKRLNMSRRAVRNLLVLMDRDEPWPDQTNAGQHRWLTQIEARKMIAEDGDFRDVTTGEPLDDHKRRRYATGAKGATARDRYYMRKHILTRNGEPIIGPDGQPLAEPPPAPLISNPVVRKAVHEVRRHLIDYLTTFKCKPDQVYIELAREARMGKKDADRLLFRNRLRNRIRRSIIDEFNLHSLTATQQRAAVDRVVLCVQQGGASARCPLCGEHDGLTPRNAAEGTGCEIAHIIPRASGGHNGLGNIVLAHTKCNRDMARRTPRQFWSDTLEGGFEEGVAWVEQIYGNVSRAKPSEVKLAAGDSLHACYFNRRDDEAKIAQFKKDVKDIQEMTNRQEAATKYAARQVMAYLADALYDGTGLPERGGERRIFATDGLWTSRLRREWGLFFDPHHSRAKELDNRQDEEARQERHRRREKDRGDHRHHSIDAVVIALTSAPIRNAWEQRERAADASGVNTADQEAIENYRRLHPLSPPAPFAGREALRAAVKVSVFADGPAERAICHRPVKRKLIGALHEETLFGPVLDRAGNLTDNYTAKKSALSLDPNHLRMPRSETQKEAFERLAARRRRESGADERAANKWARQVVASAGYTPAIVDPPPGKSGIVRDVALRSRLRECLVEGELNPDDFTANEIKKFIETKGFKHVSGVPIRTVVLLRTMSDPVIIPRKRVDYARSRMQRADDPASLRAYVGGNNHHIELRVSRDKRGRDIWTGEIVSAYEAAQRKLARLRALSQAGVPRLREMRLLPKSERQKFSPIISRVEQDHPIVDRRDDDAKGGRFVMSLCEGEMLYMKHKQTGEIGYFVVAKLDKPRSIVLVPHWDARAAGERKDADGQKVPDSKRDQFSMVPSDLPALAPPDEPHAVKVRVSPLGRVKVLTRD